MSSPNEPGSAHDAGSSGGQAPRGGPQQSGSSPAHVAESGDVPPWQRGPAARARQQQTPDGSAGEARRSGGQQGLDARLNRFIAGELPDSELVILDGLKHSILVEAPERVLVPVAGFLLRHRD